MKLFNKYTVDSVTTQQLIIDSDNLDVSTVSSFRIKDVYFSSAYPSMSLMFPFEVHRNIIHDKKNDETYVVGNGKFKIITLGERLEFFKNGKLYKTMFFKDGNFDEEQKHG